MDLPAVRNVSVRGYGRIHPRLLVIHVAQVPVSDGSRLARFCRTNPKGYRWHRTIGENGERYRHLGWNRMGAHDAGINAISVGIEHVGFVGRTEYTAMPKLLWASALETADFSRHIGRRPSRDFIIGHSEDGKFGGTSTHTDPGRTWPWGLYMDMVSAAYRGRRWHEEDEMSEWSDGFELGQARPHGDPNPDWSAEKTRGFRAGKKSVNLPAPPPVTPGDPGAHEHPHSHPVGPAEPVPP
jgi:N-acetylmuramoyl-L-alanine amidase